MSRLLLLTAVAVLAAAAHAGDGLPWTETQPGYHDSTIELAEQCFEHGLFSEAVTLCNVVRGDKAERAREITAAAADKADAYSAEAWGGYLDRREDVQRRRAQGAHDAGIDVRQVLFIDPDFAPAREKLGHKRLSGLGWLEPVEHERLATCVVALAAAPAKQEREPTWDQPWVIVGERFALITDLPWSRALRYARYLDRFDGVFFGLIGDLIPRRDQPNIVWCCKDAQTFVDFTTAAGFPMAKDSGGMHVGAHGAVYINAERCDYIGRANKSWDNLARTLFHECAHRLVEIGLRGRRGGYDQWALANTKEHAWIVESIAIVFEDLQFTKDKHTLNGLEDQRKFTIEKHWKSKEGRVPDVEPTFKQGNADFASASPISSAEKYALAGSVAWFSLFERRADYRVPYLHLLIDYYRTDTSRRNFGQRFGKPLKDFEAEWKAWVVR